MSESKQKTLPKELRQLIGVICGVYFIAGIFGFLYETGFYWLNDGMLVRRGNCYGPWVQLYGWGGLMLFALCWRMRNRPWLVFLISAGATGILELGVGWALYTFGNGFRSWDYNTEIWNWGNIGGFVCLRSVLVFAFSGLLLVYVVVPLLTRLSERMDPTAFLVLMAVPAGLFLLDSLYNDIIINIFPLRGALAFWRDTGWYGKIAGIESLKEGI